MRNLASDGEKRGAWWFLTGAIVMEVAATLSLKGALDNPWLYLVVVVGYFMSFTCLFKVLQRGMSVGVAYGIWGSVGVVATAALSALIFSEQLTLAMVAGMALIIVGVLCIEMGSNAAAGRQAR